MFSKRRQQWVTSTNSNRHMASSLTEDEVLVVKRQKMGGEDECKEVVDAARLSQLMVAYPTTDPISVQYFNTAFRSMWLSTDIDMSTDVTHWKDVLSQDHRSFITCVLGFFVASDVIVNENIDCNFMKDAKEFDDQAVYSAFRLAEVVHTQSYTLMVTTLITEEIERLNVLNSVHTNEFVRNKARWAVKYMDREYVSESECLAAFACVEGIFFSSGFCAIYWIKKQGLMPGLCQANEYIARDENLHTSFACHRYKKLREPCAHVETIVREAVELECSFVHDCLKVSLIGMDAESMCTYVKFCADRLMEQLGQPNVLYGVENPFDWMTMMSLDIKSDFFNKKITNYKNGAGQLVGRGEIPVFDA